MSTRTLRRVRNRRGRVLASTAISLALIAAPLVLIPATAGASTPDPVVDFDGVTASRNRNCVTGNLPGIYDDGLELRVNNPAGGLYESNDESFSVNVEVHNTPDGPTFDFTAAGGVVTAATVKGGPNTQIYDYLGNSAFDDDPPADEPVSADNGLHAPENPSNGKYYGLSHISFCYVQTGALRVSKTVINGEGNESFQFTVSCPAENPNPSVFALADGESELLSGIPLGTSCSVRETDPGDSDWTTSYVVDGIGREEGVAADVNVGVGVKEVAFTNTRRTAGLLVTKDVVGGTDESFQFTVRCPDVNLGSSDAGFSLGDDDSKALTEIPAGTTCSVHETDPDDSKWTTSHKVDGHDSVLGLAASVDIAAGGSVVAFTNTRNTGSLLVTKTADAEGAFLFDIDCDDGTAHDGTGVEIPTGGSYQMADVPTGRSCTVTEREHGWFTQTSVEPGTGQVTVGAGTNIVAFSNAAKPSSIAITKSGTTAVHVGDPVVYTLVVTNPGSTPVSSVTVSDPKCDGPPVRSTVDGDGLLSPGESWTYNCTRIATAADGASILNTATAEGTDPFGKAVTDTAGHTAVVLHPAISMVKTASPESISVSGTVTYTYVVTNTGDTTLFEILVSDDVLGPIGRVGRLEPGESVTMAKTVDVDALTPPRNIGTAVGTDPLGQTVSATDDAVITVVLGAVLAQPELPRTGAPLRAHTRAALAMIQVGIFLALAGRRRRPPTR